MAASWPIQNTTDSVRFSKHHHRTIGRGISEFLAQGRRHQQRSHAHLLWWHPTSDDDPTSGPDVNSTIRPRPQGPHAAARGSALRVR
jgi:hypothetical protein